MNTENEDQQKVRFQIELEFVQCLANPTYLNFLAQHGVFKQPTFVNYLKYLLYWKEPEYAKYLKYPQCLHMLDLLQSEHFRKELRNTQCARFIEDQQLLHWQHYQRKRMRLVGEQADRVTAAASVLTSPAGATPSQSTMTTTLQQLPLKRDTS
jgi:mediator of RNA polymerase II transcription subunit 31